MISFQSIMRFKIYGMLFLIGFQLIGCVSNYAATNDVEPTATSPVTEVQNTLTITPSLTMIPTITPTKTSRPTATSTRTLTPTTGPTPALPYSDTNSFDLGELLFADGQPDCRFPCWRGLRIGQSTVNDGKGVFRETFAIEPLAIAFPSNNVTTLDYQWFDPYSTMPLFDFHMLFEQSSNDLTMIVFRATPTSLAGTKIIMSPQKMIQEVGTPQHILITVEQLIGYRGIVRLLLLYEEGIGYLVEKETPMDGIITELCLHSAQESISETIFIIPPITSIDELRPYWNLVTFGNTKDALSDMRPLEEVMGYSNEEITEMANTQAPLCLYPR